MEQHMKVVDHVGANTRVTFHMSITAKCAKWIIKCFANVTIIDTLLLPQQGANTRVRMHMIIFLEIIIWIIKSVHNMINIDTRLQVQQGATSKHSKKLKIGSKKSMPTLNASKGSRKLKKGSNKSMKNKQDC